MREEVEATLIRLRRERTELLDRQLDVNALLVDTSERVPPTTIPPEWQIRLALPERPDLLDEHGGRFLWTPSTAERGVDDGGGDGDGGGGGGGGGGSGGGFLTVFPLAEPHGALDIELLEHWLREMLAADASDLSRSGATATDAEDAAGGSGGGGGWRRPPSSTARRRRRLEALRLAHREVGRASVPHAARCCSGSGSGQPMSGGQSARM